MRRGKKMLAIFSTMVMSASIATADDRMFESRSPFDSAPPSKSTSEFYSGQSKADASPVSNTGRITISQPRQKAAVSRQATQYKPTGKAKLSQVPNYYKELFGQERPYRRLENKDKTPAASQSPFQQVGHAESENSQKKFRYEEFTSEQAGKKDIVHAEFQEGNRQSAQGKIQQVSAGGRSTEQFRLPTDFKRPAPEPTNVVVPRIPNQKTVENKHHLTFGNTQQENKVTQPTGITISASPNSRRTNEPTLKPVGISSEEVSGKVSHKWIKKSEINVGQECEFELVIKNEGKQSAKDVLVEAFFPVSVRLTNSVPRPSSSRDHLEWKFESLKAGETKSITISMIPSQRGAISASAHVRFTNVLTESFTVAEPLLQVAVKGPTNVMIGEPASQSVTISNPGTGTLHNVVLEAEIPKGLEHVTAEYLQMQVGSLNPGETRTIRLALAAVMGGEQVVKVMAKAEGGLQQATQARVNVIAPKVQVAIDGPGLRYKGRSAQYVITTLNDGAAATNNVRVLHKIPAGFEFVKADHGGQFNPEDSTISWFLGRMEPGQSANVNLELKTKTIGNYVHHVRAISEHNVKSDAQIQTRIEGTAQLVLEIADLDDPVEIGTETGYKVVVQNDGSKSASSVSVSCELPPGVELISATGPTQHIAENGVVVFKSLGDLAPGDSVQYQVIVRGTVEGNHRFRARLASDSIRDPLLFEELTRFYRD
ncbi:DUF11 domain-containing protein [Gimesia fumaroli]|jgi:uncharacterized membrane protein|uniref:Large cysteine-rich periplasmic protein OmcB n=1 Tax=Gimesia fumaroli TaxID=2527976 RepID=A0A518IGW8_9PLAN|nr:DUF11 domain-containing protein [Gimesia fumaroli]QDV52327.1 Large cysteine-rich periplasmic protein OmcB precursor [Gimesia fumaroli]